MYTLEIKGNRVRENAIQYYDQCSSYKDVYFSYGGCVKKFGTFDY